MTEVRPAEAALLREALDALPWSERRVFELHAVDGLDYSAIAERLVVSVAEVEGLLAAALIRLGRHLPPTDQ